MKFYTPVLPFNFQSESLNIQAIWFFNLKHFAASHYMKKYYYFKSPQLKFLLFESTQVESNYKYEASFIKIYVELA